MRQPLVTPGECASWTGFRATSAAFLGQRSAKAQCTVTCRSPCCILVCLRCLVRLAFMKRLNGSLADNENKCGCMHARLSIASASFRPYAIKSHRNSVAHQYAGAASSAMPEEQKMDGCACAESRKACTCNGDPQNGHGNGTAHPFQNGPFAKVRPDNGPHGSLCSCQRCNHDSAGVAGSASSGGYKSIEPLASSGPALVLHSDADRREFISAGAAGGLAVRTRAYKG